MFSSVTFFASTPLSRKDYHREQLEKISAKTTPLERKDRGVYVCLQLDGRFSVDSSITATVPANAGGMVNTSRDSVAGRVTVDNTYYRTRDGRTTPVGTRAIVRSIKGVDVRADPDVTPDIRPGTVPNYDAPPSTPRQVIVDIADTLTAGIDTGAPDGVRVLS